MAGANDIGDNVEGVHDDDEVDGQRDEAGDERRHDVVAVGVYLPAHRQPPGVRVAVLRDVRYGAGGGHGTGEHHPQHLRTWTDGEILIENWFYNLFFYQMIPCMRRALGSSVQFSINKSGHFKRRNNVSPSMVLSTCSRKQFINCWSHLIEGFVSIYIITLDSGSRNVEDHYCQKKKSVKGHNRHLVVGKPFFFFIF